MKILLQEAGARPWILERRDGLARGIYNYLFADDRRPGRQILAGAQCFSERHDFCQRALGLPIGFWVESSGPLWMG